MVPGVAAALISPADHRNRAWTPTGPQGLTYQQVADELTTVLSRPIRYRRPGALPYAWHARRSLRMPRGMVAVTTTIYTIARFGKAARLTDDVRTVTHRAPISFRQFAERERRSWQKYDAAG